MNRMTHTSLFSSARTSRYGFKVERVDCIETNKLFQSV